MILLFSRTFTSMCLASYMRVLSYFSYSFLSLILLKFCSMNMLMYPEMLNLARVSYFELGMRNSGNRYSMSRGSKFVLFM